jgi:ketosteroid isomerase-like protein
MANKQTKEQSALEVLNQESVTTTPDTTPESPKPREKKVKSFADVNEKIEFHPELDKIEFEAVKGVELTIIDAKLIRDFDSKFGKHDFMIVHASDGKSADSEPYEFTFGTSGKVLIKRIM